ncbi:hypothetical protein ACIBAC_19410 [Streptomyces sp. NPDC051362]|uniref:hypothetical protein n=1 Tax=Streptomyces sp. NPDC051362 TaxID=3365651 RepID=UPI00378B18AA
MHQQSLRSCDRRGGQLSNYNTETLYFACTRSRVLEEHTPIVPEHVWLDPDVRKALTAWDFGRASRLIRLRGALRPDDMAQLTGLSQAFLSIALTAFVNQWDIAETEPLHRAAGGSRLASELLDGLQRTTDSLRTMDASDGSGTLRELGDANLQLLKGLVKQTSYDGQADGSPRSSPTPPFNQDGSSSTPASATERSDTCMPRSVQPRPQETSGSAPAHCPKWPSTATPPGHRTTLSPQHDEPAKESSSSARPPSKPCC